MMRGSVFLLFAVLLQGCVCFSPSLLSPWKAGQALRSRCNSPTKFQAARSASPLTLHCSVTADAETRLLELVGNTKGRGQKASPEELQAIGEALSALEQDGGIPNPVLSPVIQGDWELLYTSKSKFDIKNPLGRRVDGSKPGVEGLFGVMFKEADEATSSSPIQRTVTSIDGITITQEIVLDGPDPRVDQRVVFGSDYFLRLSASAGTQPESEPSKIFFTFDLAYFQLGPIRIPYPVPFKLLGDEARGWLDTVYLSEQLRVSRGNKGTTFVLRRR